MGIPVGRYITINLNCLSTASQVRPKPVKDIREFSGIMWYFVACQTHYGCNRFGFQLTSVHYLINSGPSFLHIVNVIREMGKIVKFLTLVCKR